MIQRITFIAVFFLLFSSSAGLALSQPLNPSKRPPLTTAQAFIQNVEAADLASAMDIDSLDLITVSIDTSDSQGTGLADAPLSFFPRQGDTFAILSTGLATSADDPDTNNDEIPMEGGLSDDVSHVLAGLNNSDGHDLVRLRLVLKPPPGKTSLSFDFAFYSEEFPDFIGSDFNDVFVAELGAEPFTSALVVEGSKISAPANIAFDPNGEFLSVNAAFGFDPDNPNPDTGTTYDGTSGLLRATGCLPEELPTGNVVLIFSITDVGDALLDSAVFLDNFQWDDPAECRSGAEQAAIILNPEAATKSVGSAHTVTATVFDSQTQPIPNQEVGFKIEGANSATGQATTMPNGQATFSYVGSNAGEDTITAWIDGNSNQVQDSNEPFDTATVVWETVSPEGTITIIKEAKGAKETHRFGFSGDLGDFKLAAGETKKVGNLSPGDYFVIETQLPKHWELLWVQCNGEALAVQDFADPPGRGVDIPLEAGQDLECIFHNERTTFEAGEGETFIYFPFFAKKKGG